MPFLDCIHGVIIKYLDALFVMNHTSLCKVYIIKYVSILFLSLNIILL